MQRITCLPREIKQQLFFCLHDRRDLKLEATLARILEFLQEDQTPTVSHDAGRIPQQADSEIS